MGKKFADVMITPVRLSTVSSGRALDAVPPHAHIGVGVIRTDKGPVVALALGDGSGGTMTAILNDVEFSALAMLMMQAGEKCAAGAKDAPKAEPYSEH